MSDAATFLSGATAMACLAIAVYFLRSWRRSGERLLAIFALAFAVFAVNRVALLLIDEQDESARVAVYVLRLLAFVLIIAAIVDKNRARESQL